MTIRIAPCLSPRPPLPPTLTGAWLGWLRTLPGGHWRPVVSAGTYGEAWDALLDVPGGRQSERMVLNRERRP